MVSSQSNMGLTKFGTEVSNLEQDLLPGRHRRERGRLEVRDNDSWEMEEVRDGLWKDLQK